MNLKKASFVVIAVLGAILVARPALSHCDTADGPVVGAAKTALEKGVITPVLKWVRPEAESEIRAAFPRALAVREFVAAYVEFTHYVERLHRDATTSAAHAAPPASAEHKH